MDKPHGPIRTALEQLKRLAEAMGTTSLEAAADTCDIVNAAQRQSPARPSARPVPVDLSHFTPPSGSKGH